MTMSEGLGGLLRKRGDAALLVWPHQGEGAVRKRQAHTSS